MSTLSMFNCEAWPRRPALLVNNQRAAFYSDNLTAPMKYVMAAMFFYLLVTRLRILPLFRVVKGSSASAGMSLHTVWNASKINNHRSHDI